MVTIVAKINLYTVKGKGVVWKKENYINVEDIIFKWVCRSQEICQWF
jgi:hypothetical protein